MIIREATEALWIWSGLSSFPPVVVEEVPTPHLCFHVFFSFFSVPASFVLQSFFFCLHFHVLELLHSSSFSTSIHQFSSLGSSGSLFMTVHGAAFAGIGLARIGGGATLRSGLSSSLLANITFQSPFGPPVTR